MIASGAKAENTPGWRRRLPALALFVFSPLIAEYLLGSLSTSQIALLPLMAMLYGSGAVVIREWVRRSGRGWPSLILLAIAYGLVEEGLVTQSLFNPNYLHLRLLDYGWIPALGTSAPWLVYVVSLHVFWSISVPIGLTEALFVDKQDVPWLRRTGILVFVLLFLLGAAAIATFTYKQVPFIASPLQLGTTTALAAILALIAWRLPPRVTVAGAQMPSPMVLFLAAFLPGSAFAALELYGRQVLRLSWPVAAAGLVGLEVLLLLFMLRFTRGARWSPFQRFAVAAGGLGVYLWYGFPIEITLHGSSALSGHIVVALLMVVLAVVAGRRTYRAGH
jgi:hypothetical protein